MIGTHASHCSCCCLLPTATDKFDTTYRTVGRLTKCTCPSYLDNALTLIILPIAGFAAEAVPSKER
ncbi:hypothetical protein BDP81DRAFT_180556 [Colletotrichum phormii]|uniref:Uncharacterized protein n=1 Tax=Colletotrichum phormii TaxID=359342 RepID=A0AAJ0EHU4_9PEZI|nr:uncharacterized protein BDP81DRAFT_180556 [Colletotrichum phormii]KAK1639623.1 hypothetical protein BDP81DRAFT_180556 [Colletotrichum phormii]